MDSRDWFIAWVNDKGNMEALTLWIGLGCLLFMVAVVLSQPAAAKLGGETWMISRYDCSVWASKSCGERGLASVYTFDENKTKCVWGCRLTRQQSMMLVWMRTQLRLYNYYTLREK